MLCAKVGGLAHTHTHIYDICAGKKSNSMSCAKVGGSAHPAAPAHHAKRTSAGMGDTHTHTRIHIYKINVQSKRATACHVQKLVDQHTQQHQHITRSAHLQAWATHTHTHTHTRAHTHTHKHTNEVYVQAK